MHPEWKKKWIDALRSGEYKQGRGGLRMQHLIEQNGVIFLEDRYCVLGVLCDISGMGHWSGTAQIGGRTYACVFEDSEKVTSLALLPKTVSIASGLDTSKPKLLTSGESYPVPITRLNDNGLSFEQLADLIEQQL